MKNFQNLVFLISIFLVTGLGAKEVNTTFFGNLALDGYDPVAYFTEGKPTLGKSQWEYKWADAIWRFSSNNHRKLFMDNPEKYSPQYGGYCAFAMNEGEKYDISPDSWEIHKGKLYLNYDPETHKLWTQDKESMIANADKYWIKIRKKK
jgi:YHS domain-containing protein